MGATQLKEVGKVFKNQEVQELNQDMQDNLHIIIERIEWLLDGNYGYDEMIAITRLLERGFRGNINAIIFQAMAKLEYRVTQAQANQVYNNQFTSTQELLNKAITDYIPESEAFRLAR